MLKISFEREINADIEKSFDIITNLKTGVSNIIGDPKNKKRVQGTFSPIKKPKKGD